MHQKLLGYAVRLSVLEYLIIQAVPFLNHFRPAERWPYSLRELHAFPASSWGAQLAAFLDARSFDTFLPNYAGHDAFHALLKYETDVYGELRLQAFMVGNRSASIAGYGLLLLGAVLMPELWPQLCTDYQRGKGAACVGKWDVPSLLKEDLAVVCTLLEP